MNNYVIHACPKRMWYVDKYLVPSLQNQGIDVRVMCDEYRIGNLEYCMRIFESMNGDGGTWHLQDDVIICRDFKERTEAHTSGIACGFVWTEGGNEYVEEALPKDMWLSFPCIYIPNHMARECAEWYHNSFKHDERYLTYVVGGQYDDLVFQKFLEVNYPNEKIKHIRPNLVDHVDYLLGGTSIKRISRSMSPRAMWFEDLDLVKELEEKIRSDKHG